MLNKKNIENILKAKEEGKTIGLVQGSWDFFHIGHLKYLIEAKKLCDFLIVGIDSDKKIQKRKGLNRPLFPLKERLEFIRLLNIGNELIVKEASGKKWELIKTIKPDVLIAIKENYTDEEITDLETYCGQVAILERQSQGSTSDRIRKLLISDKINLGRELDVRVLAKIQELLIRNELTGELDETLSMLIENLKKSTDWEYPVSAAYRHNEKWYLGANQIDHEIPKSDIENRTELFYATVEHAEINLLKNIGDIRELNGPLWVTLFPCDRCMKVLIQKGIKEIYFLEDHPERNWSKRSHKLAQKKGIKTIKIIPETNLINNADYPVFDSKKYNFIDPNNARQEKQLEIMLDMENQGKDPLDKNNIDQEILFETDHWYVTKNRFPYENAEQHFMLVSNNPVYSLEEMSKEMWSDLKKVSKKITNDYNFKGGAFFFRFGETSLSGATLKRIHCHMIMPKINTKVKPSIGIRHDNEKVLKLKNNLKQKK